MARLSQKAWNNVIIFSMLIMITVLNLDRFSEGNASNSGQLLDDGALILSIQIDQNIIERIGQSWRISPDSPAASEDIDAEKLAILVNNWQKTIVKQNHEINDMDIFKRPRHIAVLWLAGEPEPRVYPITIVNDVPMFAVDGQAMTLDFPNLSQLVSW